MSLFSNKSELESYGIDYSVKDISGNTKRYEVTMASSWSDSLTGRRGELFNVGGGSVYNSYPVNNFGFGSYTFTPNQNFLGHVNIWGAGGGAYHNSGTRMAGGGGYAQALIRFKANTPYTVVVGQAGNHNGLTSHGGGGSAYNAGGGGGGLSGIFMGVDAAGSAPWAGTAPVTQAQALIIAGGGGGGGHHNQGSHYGNGGAGGGWFGKRGHNSGPGTQTSGGTNSYSNSTPGFALHGGNSSTQSWTGGAGGGWFGGGGGGHSGSHHDGGSGGSGHLAHPSTIATQPNNGLSGYILNGFLERGQGHMEYTENRPANFHHPLNVCEGRHAGMGGWGETETNHGPTWGSRHGKVVITLYPDFVGKLMFPTHTSPNDGTGWTQTY